MNESFCRQQTYLLFVKISKNLFHLKSNRYTAIFFYFFLDETGVAVDIVKVKNLCN